MAHILKHIWSVRGLIGICHISFKVSLILSLTYGHLWSGFLSNSYFNGQVEIKV